MKILAIDDDSSALEILSMLVAHAGYSDIETAASAGIALERITSASRPFECILLDIQMPVMDGIEFCDLLRRLPGYADCPIIMVTAMTDKRYMDQAYAAGASAYVTKPFDANGLAVCLADAARRLGDARMHG